MRTISDILVGVLQGGEAPHSALARQSLVAVGPLLLTISLGMTSGYSAILLPQLPELDTESASWIASIAALPMAFGCLLGGFLMEKLGRKRAHLITALPCVAGWLAIGCAMNTPTLLIGRFLTGLCGGLLGPCTGAYIGETSEPKFRGFLLAGISLAVAIGLFLVHLLGTFLSWQMTALICAIFPVLGFGFLLVVPESPAWLVKQNRIEEAQNAVYWCRGFTDDAKKEIATMVNNQNNTKNTMLCSREFIVPLVVIVVFIVTNQWAGVNALTFYSVSIMQKTLGEGLDGYIAMLIVDVIRMAMSIIACLLMKKIGRRPLAITSGVGTTACLFILSSYSYFVGNERESWYYTIIPMVALVGYISFISVGFVPLPWAMMGEVFPLEGRNIGTSISSFMAFSAFFSVVKTNPVMLATLSTAGTFLVYGVVAMIGTIFITVMLPETKNRTLQEIEDSFKRNQVENHNNNKDTVA